jgi:hypothetical protein
VTAPEPTQPLTDSELKAIHSLWVDYRAMLDELAAAYDHLDRPEGYEVYPARWVLVDELTAAEAAALGVTNSLDEVPELPERATAEEFADHEAEWEEASENRVFHDANGNELDPQSRVPIRVSDPIPHYRHGRVEPVLTARKDQA